MALHGNHTMTAQQGGANPLDILMKNLDSVPNMIYGFVLIIAISFADNCAHPEHDQECPDSWGRSGLPDIQGVQRCFVDCTSIAV